MFVSSCLSRTTTFEYSFVKNPSTPCIARTLDLDGVSLLAYATLLDSEEFIEYSARKVHVQDGGRGCAQAKQEAAALVRI